ISVTDQQSSAVEPKHVSGFGSSGRANLTHNWYALIAEKPAMRRGFHLTIAFAGTHQNRAIVCYERGIMGVDRIQRQLGGFRQVQKFGARRGEFGAKFLVL